MYCLQYRTPRHTVKSNALQRFNTAGKNPVYGHAGSENAFGAFAPALGNVDSEDGKVGNRLALAQGS